MYKPCKVIAEIGCNHKGEIQIAKDLIVSAKDCGADIAKFQKRNNKELLPETQYNAPHPNPINSYGKTYGEHREFLEFSKSVGNDLSTPIPHYGFEGLKQGDRWCLCANRWLEAYEANSAPKIVAKATNIKALEIIPMEIIKGFAIDLV